MIEFPSNSYILKQIKKNVQARLVICSLGIGFCALIAYLSMHDAKDDTQWIGYLFILGGFACIYGTYRAVVQFFNPEKHEVIKSLTSYGPTDQIISDIENELKSPELSFPNGIITKSWLVGGSMHTLAVAFIPEIVWAHKKTVTQQYVIKNHSVVVYKRSGHFFEITGKDKECMQILEVITKKVPWAILGYSPEISKLWRSDRTAFISSVDRRKGDALQT